MAPKKEQPRSMIDTGEEGEDGEQDNRPQYRLTAESYIEDHLLQPGALVRYEEVPGWHMEPVNAAAKAKCNALWPNGRPPYVDPIQSMSMTTKPTEESMTLKLMTTMMEQMAAQTAALSALAQKRAA